MILQQIDYLNKTGTTPVPIDMIMWKGNFHGPHSMTKNSRW